MLFFPAIYCPKQFHKLFYLIFPTTLEGKCYFYPHFTFKGIGRRKAKGLVQGHTTKWLRQKPRACGPRMTSSIPFHKPCPSSRMNFYSFELMRTCIWILPLSHWVCKIFISYPPFSKGKTALGRTEHPPLLPLTGLALEEAFLVLFLPLFLQKHFHIPD